VICRSTYLAAASLADEREEALVVLRASGAVAQVLGEGREQLVDVPALELALHILRKMEIVQVNPRVNRPICWAFAEPSDGLEPTTPSLS
jgi:hypothetical protein